MDTWAFWGGFAAVAIAVMIVFLIVRRKLRRLSQEVFGTASILRAVRDMNLQEASPRSVNANDRMIIPQILKDFPDFDPVQAKTCIREYLERHFADKKSRKIHKIAYTGYLSSGAQKTVVFQTAIGWKENGQTVEKRFTIHYTYMIISKDKTVAANCPNCGAPLGYGAVCCSYCDCRVVNVMKNVWKVTEITES